MVSTTKRSYIKEDSKESTEELYKRLNISFSVMEIAEDFKSFADSSSKQRVGQYMSFCKRFRFAIRTKYSDEDASLISSRCLKLFLEYETFNWDTLEESYNWV